MRHCFLVLNWNCTVSDRDEILQHPVVGQRLLGID